MKPNEVYTDLEKKKPDKATNAVQFLETTAYFPFNNDGISLDEAGNEVVSITDAIRATQMAELQALEWSRTVKPIELEYRIKQLKQQI